jgi:hypothetical protein
MRPEPGKHIPVSESHAANRGVLAHLRLGPAATTRLSARPGDVEDPYYKLGSHPDVVEHLWDVIGASLPRDCRCVVLGRPALAHPRRGVVLAVGLGTTYALRFAPADLAEIRAANLQVVHRYGSSDVLDLTGWGADWCFGAFDRREPKWCGRAFRRLDA